MYNNVGQKIKGVAIGLFLSEAVGAIVSGIALMATDEDFILLGILLLVVGPFVAYLMSLFVYGFGELIEKTADVAEKAQFNPQKNVKKATKESKKKEVQAYIKVEKAEPKEIEEIPADEGDYIDFVCPNCGKDISFHKGETEVTCPWCETSLELR